MAWLSLLEFTRSFAQITHLNFKDKTKSFVVQEKIKHKGLWVPFNFKSLGYPGCPLGCGGQPHSPPHPLPTVR